MVSDAVHGKGVDVAQEDVGEIGDDDVLGTHYEKK